MTFSTKEQSPEKSQKLDFNVLGLSLIFLTPMLGGFLYGFDIGITSFALAMTQHTQVNSGAFWWSHLSSLQQGLFVSSLSLGALIGSHVVLIYLANRIGRRMELRVCASLYLIDTICIVLSATWFHEAGYWGFSMLFLGRIIFGMGVAFNMHGAPAYLAEMCPAEIRGAVVSAKETVIVGGIVFGYAIGNLFSKDPSRWFDLYAMSSILSLPMLGLTWYIPRSKRWLLMKGFREEAYESMKYVYNGDISAVFEDLVRSVHSKRPAEESVGCNETAMGGEHSLWDRNYRPAMIASMGLIIFQQFSGQPSVLSYATILFQAAGWSGNASVVSSILMMFTSMTTVALVDKVGRKRLLLAGCFIMMTALSALSTTFWGWNDEAQVGFNATEQNIILVAMFIYIAGYQVGFGPITWCVASEIFPMEIRGRAIALGVELNYCLNFLVQLAFPIVQDSLGWGPSFCLFGSILAFCIFFVQMCVPETTGLTLEKIQAQLSLRSTDLSLCTVLSSSLGDSFEDDDRDFYPSEQTCLLRSDNHWDSGETEDLESQSRCTAGLSMIC